MEFIHSAETAIVDLMATLMPLGFPFWGLILLLAIGVGISALMRGRGRGKKT